MEGHIFLSFIQTVLLKYRWKTIQTGCWDSLKGDHDCLTLKLPWVTKTEFFLTISIQYQPDNDKKKNINLRIIIIIIDSILNSLNQPYKNFMVDSEENYKFDLRVKGFLEVTA